MFRFLPRLILSMCCVAAIAPASAQPPSVAETTARATLEKRGVRFQDRPVPGKDKQVLAILIYPSFCKVTDADLKWLKDIPGVTELHLESKLISDEGLKHLKDMPPGLVSLHLKCDQISDEGLKHLKDLPPGLVSLHLQCDKISDEGLKHLKDLPPGLASLLLECDKISDDGLQYLKDLKRLNGLALRCAKVTDRGMTSLASLKQLRALELYAPLLTDVGLKELHALRNVESLRIGHCHLSDAALLQFKKSLPRLKDSSDKIPAFKDAPDLGAFTVQKFPRLISVAPLAASPKDDAATRLGKLRFNAARETFSWRYRRYLSGLFLLADQPMLKVLGGMVDATQELDEFPERAAVLDGVADMLQVAWTVMESQVEVGRLQAPDAAEMRYDILTLELRILRAKRAKGKT